MIPTPEQSKPRVLIIESDAEITSLLRVLLDREGFDIASMEHGPEAMKKIADDECLRFDAIVVQCAPVASPAAPDRSMGVAFITFLAERHPECLARTVVLTTITRHIPEQFAATCSVLPEPFDIDELTNAVRMCACQGG